MTSCGIRNQLLSCGITKHMELMEMLKSRFLHLLNRFLPVGSVILALFLRMCLELNTVIRNLSNSLDKRLREQADSSASIIFATHTFNILSSQSQTTPSSETPLPDECSTAEKPNKTTSHRTLRKRKTECNHCEVELEEFDKKCCGRPVCDDCFEWKQWIERKKE